MGTSAAVKRYCEAMNLSVSRHVIERAVRNLSRIEALALIRDAFGGEEGSTSLAEAQEIYCAIKAR